MKYYREIVHEVTLTLQLHYLAVTVLIRIMFTTQKQHRTLKLKFADSTG